MSIKEQIRKTTDPDKFVKLALDALKSKHDSDLIPPGHFEDVTRRVFDCVSALTLRRRCEAFTDLHAMGRLGPN